MKIKVVQSNKPKKCLFSNLETGDVFEDDSGQLYIKVSEALSMTPSKTCPNKWLLTNCLNWSSKSVTPRFNAKLVIPTN